MFLLDNQSTQKVELKYRINVYMHETELLTHTKKALQKWRALMLLEK